MRSNGRFQLPFGLRLPLPMRGKDLVKCNTVSADKQSEVKNAKYYVDKIDTQQTPSCYRTNLRRKAAQHRAVLRGTELRGDEGDCSCAVHPIATAGDDSGQQVRRLRLQRIPTIGAAVSAIRGHELAAAAPARGNGDGCPPGRAAASTQSIPAAHAAAGGGRSGDPHQASGVDPNGFVRLSGRGGGRNARFLHLRLRRPAHCRISSVQFSRHARGLETPDRKSTRLNSSHGYIS